MRSIIMALTTLTGMFCSSVGAEGVSKEISAQTQMDCSNMSPDVQQFASQLSSANKKMFCGQFNDSQRAAAMQYATQLDVNGNMMSADQAVQKVATENNMKPSQKSPTGCPIK